MALRGDGLSYLADWPLGMSPASAVAIVRGDGVGSNATAAARPALPGLAGDRGTITVVPEAPVPCWSPTISISSAPRPTGIANDRHPSAAEGSQFNI
jgi:hypothetical protein